MNRQRVVSFDVDCVSLESTVNTVCKWAEEERSAYVCVANVHMVMEAFDSLRFQTVVKNADLVVPDGMPLVWVMRLAGIRDQTRVRGPSLMPLLCGAAEKKKLSVGFIGGADGVLKELKRKVEIEFPCLDVAYCYSPPFRSLSDFEAEAIVQDINSSGVNILFVGLGCPKQEKWMAEHIGRVRSVMLGVGAAFDLYAGTIKQCPMWLQSIGMEWAFRFKEEPRRLAGRYFRHNPRFVMCAIRQLLGF